MKKKLLSLALAMALCLGLTVPALAANPFSVTDLEEVSIFTSSSCAITFSDVVSEEDTPDSRGKQFHVYNLSADAIVTINWAPVEGKESDAIVPLLMASASKLINGACETKYIEMKDVNYSCTLTKADMLALDPDAKYFSMSLAYADMGSSGPYYVTFGGSSAETPADVPAAPAFTDVAADSPFKDAIAWAVEQKITNGTSATTFGPSNTCTHNHILTFLWRANGSPASEGANDFEKAIAWAKSKGLAETIDGGAACTRAQTMMYLWKLAGSPETAVNDTFTDVAADADYAQAVAWAVAQGVTKGTSATTFGPDNTCTRGQIVTFLYRNMK